VCSSDLGSNAKLCKCSGNERGLALKRDRGLCHNVGKYCSERDPVFKKCLVRKTNYCCFNSKLSRIFHEQGRAQLGISWGSAKHPDCRAFTLDEFSKIDFSKFKMEELFDDVLGKGKSKSGKKIRILAEGQVPEAQKERMQTISKGEREIRSRPEEQKTEKDRQIIIKKYNIEQQIIQKNNELQDAEVQEVQEVSYWNAEGHKTHPRDSSGYLQEWSKVQNLRDKIRQLKSEIHHLNAELSRLR